MTTCCSQPPISYTTAIGCLLKQGFISQYHNQQTPDELQIIFLFLMSAYTSTEHAENVQGNHISFKFCAVVITKILLTGPLFIQKIQL